MQKVLYDEKLSLKAKGLYMLLYIDKQEYMTIEKISEYSKDGRDAIRSARNELIKKGYLKVDKVRNNGKILGSKWIIER